MSDLQEKVGERIRSLRKQRELSQQALAEKAGISYKYLGEVERGQVNLSIDILMKIVTALDAEVGDLFDKKPVESDTVIKGKLILSDLPESSQVLALKLLEALKEHS